MSFFVPGDTVQQGSVSVFNGRVVHQNSVRLKAWRNTIGAVASEHCLEKLEGPIGLELIFAIRRPKSVKRLLPFVRPDLDKYIRAALDALTNVAYVDDEQVCKIIAEKVYSPVPGLFITIYSMNEH